MSGVRHETVGPEEGDQRLDRWFKRRFPDLSHVRLEKMLRKGEVRLDGARAKAADRVAVGQVVRVPPFDATPAPASERPPTRLLAPEEAERARHMVLYRDEHVLVIDKPPGLAVQGGEGQRLHVDALTEALRFERADRPRLVHRLDKDTSGVLVLGRSPASAAALAKAFRSRTARKLYWAVVCGAPRPRNGTIRLALEKSGGGPTGRLEKMRVVAEADLEAHEDAKRATTDYATIEAAGQRCAWMALRPVTGRTHQLRAHLSAIGAPIVGDGKYYDPKAGGPADGPWLGGEISRKLHLHARAIAIPHPAGDGRVLSVVAAPPEHMRRTFAALAWRIEDAPEEPFAALDAELGRKSKA